MGGRENVWQPKIMAGSAREMGEARPGGSMMRSCGGRDGVQWAYQVRIGRGLGVCARTGTRAGCALAGCLRWSHPGGEDQRGCGCVPNIESSHG